MNELELQSRINEIYTLIDGLEKNSFEVSNKPFGDKPVNINFLFSFIGIDKDKIINDLFNETEKLKSLLNAKNKRHCTGCVLFNR